MNETQNATEILAPAGDFASVVAGVRCGANAVYLGGTRLNARKGASTFTAQRLKETVAYCHARDVAVHLTLNTIVFDTEIDDVLLSIKEASAAEVDALIVQDLAVAKLAQQVAPTIALHGSTQLSVHNLAGVQALANLGFSRAVVARELSLAELAYLCQHSPLAIETFVHGALCMSVSGQCYLSGMLGGRSGNRGNCAQPCRLPFASEQNTHALSLKDLSQIQHIPAYQEMGIASLKIEGRLKRPEYVAAAVTACVQAKKGEPPDYETLQAVFSRSGFTDGYATANRGDHMFGTRQKADVVSGDDVYKKLAQLYHKEVPLVPVTMAITLRVHQPASLTVTDRQGRAVTVEGKILGKSHKTPTTQEQVQASLEKTGGTPFYVEHISFHMDSDGMIPPSGVNELRREALEQLLALRSTLTPHNFAAYTPPKVAPRQVPERPALRIRVASIHQITPALAQDAEYVILPLHELPEQLPTELLPLRDKIMLELPRIVFDPHTATLHDALTRGQALGIAHVLVTNLYGLSLLDNFYFVRHGDFTLNTTNAVAANAYGELGFVSMTMSLEFGLLGANPAFSIPRGVIQYGSLPMMTYRNHPAGMQGKDGFLTDRKGIRFWVQREGEVSVLYNSVPLSMADRSGQLQGLDFTTLYFTHESPEECLAILKNQKEGQSPTKFTRGMYQPRVL